jgi:enoyl-CoA hydratase/carnithine racemase
MLSCVFSSVAKLARYLALSGRPISAHDMYVLGLLTHIVGDKAVNVMGNSLPRGLSLE